jgi:hypothetical protein
LAGRFHLCFFFCFFVFFLFLFYNTFFAAPIERQSTRWPISPTAVIISYAHRVYYLWLLHHFAATLSILGTSCVFSSALPLLFRVGRVTDVDYTYINIKMLALIVSMQSCTEGLGAGRGDLIILSLFFCSFTFFFPFVSAR